MEKKLLKAAVAAAAALAFVACSEAPKPAEPAPEATKEATKAPEPVAAKTAFWEIYKLARTWATDVTPLTLVSGELTGYNNVDGKAALWTAVFVSPSRGESRTFTYAIDSAGATVKGVTASAAERWGGATKEVQPFQSSAFVIDSDQAYKTASEKAAAWVKANPGKKVSMTLGSASRFPAPVWAVMWGDRKSGYLSIVNAATGQPMK